MKKIGIVLALVSVLLFTSCTEFAVARKSFKSATSGLDREVTVTDFHGKQVWHYSGKMLITEDSTFGDVTIAYYEGKELKKIDFIGLYNIKAVEK